MILQTLSLSSFTQRLSNLAPSTISVFILNSLKDNLGALNTAINKESMKGGKRRRKGKKSKKVKKRRSRRSKRTYGGNTPNEEEDNNEEEYEAEPEPEPETKNEPPVEVKTNSKQGIRIATEDNPCGIWESITKRCMSKKQHALVQERKQQQECIKDCKKSKTEGGRRRKRGTKKKRKHR